MEAGVELELFLQGSWVQVGGEWIVLELNAFEKMNPCAIRATYILNAGFIQ